MDRHSKSALFPVVAFILSTVGSSLPAVEMALGSYDNVPNLSEPVISQSQSVSNIDGLPVVCAERFSLNYEFDDQTMKYVSRIELWCGNGKSGPWQLYDYDLDRTPPVEFSVASEGIWRFLIVPVDVNGVRYYQGSNGNTTQSTNTIPASVPAQTTVFVDYTKPQIFMHEPLLQSKANGKKHVVIQWNVFDSFLSGFPVELFWIEAGKQQWQPVGTAFKAFDSYSFVVPDNVSRPMYFKLVCKDKAGNVQESVSKAVSLTGDSGGLEAVNSYDNKVYALSNNTVYQDIPAYPSGSPLVSTDINSPNQPEPSANQGIPNSSFQPKGVGVVPLQKDNMPVDSQNSVPEQQGGQLQRQYTVEPAINSNVALENSTANNNSQSVNISKRASEYLLMGQDAYQRGEYERARMIYEQVIAMEPNYYKSYYLLADVLYLQGKVEQAKDNFEIFLKHNPNHSKALLGLMYCHLKLNNLNQAKDLLNKINQLNEDDQRWNSLLEQ